MYQVTFKHMDSSPAVREQMEEKLDNIFEKYSLKPTSVKITFSVNKSCESIHLSAHFNDGFQLEIEQDEEDMYDAVNKAASRFERQLRKHKEKINHHKGSKVEPELDIDIDIDEEDEDA